MSSKVKNIVHERWIKIELSMICNAALLIKNKKRMQEYADELGWRVVVDKEGTIHESGNRVYGIKAVPQDKDEKISPEECRLLWDKLLGFSYSLLIDLSDDNEVVHTFGDNIIKFMTVSKKEDVIFQLILGDTLLLEYPLIKRIELEKVEPNLAKIIFQRYTQEMFDKFEMKTGLFKNFFQDKNVIEEKKKAKTRLKEWFGAKFNESYFFG